jgi:hypothetical protein
MIYLYRLDPDPGGQIRPTKKLKVVAGKKPANTTQLPGLK